MLLLTRSQEDDLKTRYLTKQKRILIERVQIYEKAQGDLRFRAAILELCRRDPIYFMSYFLVTYDPRKNPATLALILFDKQEKYIKWLQYLYGGGLDSQWGVLLKSRDTGASVLSCAFLVWNFIFVPNFSGSLASRKADLVYKRDDPDALFTKVIGLIECLPSWLKPRYNYKWMLIKNLDNGANIKGESGDAIGRGGRSSIVFVDEAAFLENPDAAISGLSRNTDCAILLSTPNGENTFARLYKSGEFPNFMIHWTDDPRRGLDWYNEQKKKFPPAIIARELDCDFSASVEGLLVEPKWVESAIDYKCRNDDIIEFWQPIIAGLDVAGSSDNSDTTVLTIRQGNVILEIFSWTGLSIPETTQKTINICHELGVLYLYFDAIGIGSGVASVLELRNDLKFEYEGVWASGKPSENYWLGDNKTSREKFHNYRAELWFLIAERLRYTWETSEELDYHEHEKLISIPNNPDLIKQLSQPKWSTSPQTGKIVIESKKDMKKRGLKSPDFADSLILTEAYDGANLEWIKYL